MQELVQMLQREQPRFNAVLQKYLEEVPPLARPASSHVLSAGGKRLRPLLTLLTGRALGCTHEGLYSLGLAVEILHAATMLHDDILDNAPLRRGRPAAHTLFGTAPIILAGDIMLAKALLMVSSFGDARMTACISEAVMRTIEGEMEEFDTLRNLDMGQDAYRSIITGKTAWMLRASCELGALHAGASDEVVAAAARFGLELGIAFQMVDDALDFYPPEKTGKPMGGDLREGKVTPPLLLYLETLPPGERSAFSEQFMSGSLNAGEVEHTAQAIYAGGFADKTRELAALHLDHARAALAVFPACEERAVLEQAADFIQNREQ